MSSGRCIDGGGERVVACFYVYEPIDGKNSQVTGAVVGGALLTFGLT